jgi:hypothetical protein
MRAGVPGRNMEKNYQRRLKAKLSLMECDLTAARKMLYNLELFTVEGFRNEWHLNFRKWFSLKKFHVLYCSCEHGDGRRAFEVIE